MRRTRLAALGGAALQVLACGAEPTDDTGTHSDPNPEAMPAATLEDALKAYPCPRTFSVAADASSQLCGDRDGSLRVASGQTHSFVVRLFGTGWAECVYDLASSALVGIFVSNDGGAPALAGDLGDDDRPGDLATFRQISCGDADLAAD